MRDQVMTYEGSGVQRVPLYRRRHGMLFDWVRAHPKIYGAYKGRARWLTGPFRVLPDFVIIGAQKCGTTSLYDFVTRHPDVAPARVKEVNHFTFRDRIEFITWDKPAEEQETFGTNWYRSNFPTVLSRRLHRIRHGRNLVTGEATTAYLPYPGVPERMVRLLPDAKIIVMLRNPVDRAYSAYHFYRQYYYETRTFEDAIAQEMNGTETRYTRTYLVHGRYADHLERWFTHYPRERFLVLVNTELRSDPEMTMSRVWKFLGLRAHSFGRDAPPDLNVGSYAPMQAKTRSLLESYYAPHDARLVELLGGRRLW